MQLITHITFIMKILSWGTYCLKIQRSLNSVSKRIKNVPKYLKCGADLMSLDMFSVPGLVPAHLVKYVLCHIKANTTKAKRPTKSILLKTLNAFFRPQQASMHHNLTVQHIPAVC